MKDAKSNGCHDIILQAIEEIESEQGEKFSLERINLAELKRRAGISRAKLRRLKQNGFAEVPQYFARPKVPADHPDRLHRHSGRYASQRNYQFCGVSGATASRRLSRWLHYGKRLHCILQVFDACKTTAGSPTGKTWLTFHHRARRSLPDGLGISKVLDYDGSEYNVAYFAMVYSVLHVEAVIAFVAVQAELFAPCQANPVDTGDFAAAFAGVGIEQPCLFRQTELGIHGLEHL